MPSYLVSDGFLLCPRPRRLRCFGLDSEFQSELSDSRFEILDMIFIKENYSPESNYHVPCSPPFFMGSPPSRASNPVTQDVQFGSHKLNLLSSIVEYPTISPHKDRKCSRARCKQKAAAVRIEGFNISSNCSVSSAV